MITLTQNVTEGTVGINCKHSQNSPRGSQSLSANSSTQNVTKGIMSINMK